MIEQAKGVLAERFSEPVEEIFELLRREARDNGVSLHRLAAAVLSSEETPPQIARLRER